VFGDSQEAENAGGGGRSLEEVYDAVVMVISYQRLALFLDSETQCYEDYLIVCLLYHNYPRPHVGRDNWATGWTARGSNSSGGEIFRACPDWPSFLPSRLYYRYRLFAGGKAAEVLPIHPHLAPRLKKQ
jgi:hypothetical protein